MTAAVKPASASNMAGKIRGLRITALAGLVMLLLEYGLGVWTNLYAHLPASDHGKTTFAAFGGAVAHGAFREPNLRSQLASDLGKCGGRSWVRISDPSLVSYVRPRARSAYSGRWPGQKLLFSPAGPG